MFLSNYKLNRMLKGDLWPIAEKLDCKLDPKAKKPEIIAAIKVKQAQGVPQVQAVQRVPGDKQLFEQLTLPEAAESAEPYRPEPAGPGRGGKREGSGRKPNVSNDQSRIDNLTTEPNRTVKIGLKWIFKTLARAVDCKAIALDAEELHEFAVDITQCMQYHKITIPEGIAIDGKLILTSVEMFGSRYAMYKAHKARMEKQKEKEKSNDQG